MVTSASTTEQDEVELRPATLDLKVEQKLQDVLPQVERSIDPDREVAATWFYWSPSPGVRCYTYGDAADPVRWIEPEELPGH